MPEETGRVKKETEGRKVPREVAAAQDRRILRGGSDRKPLSSDGVIVDPASEAARELKAAAKRKEAGEGPKGDIDGGDAEITRASRERGRAMRQNQQLATENEDLKRRLAEFEAKAGVSRGTQGEGEEGDEPVGDAGEGESEESQIKKPGEGEDDAALPEEITEEKPDEGKSIDDVLSRKEQLELGAKWKEKGELDEADYTKLKKAMGVSRSQIDTYMKGQAALAQEAESAVYNVFGGKAGFDKAARWASRVDGKGNNVNLSKAEIDAINKMTTSSDVETARAGARMFRRLYEAANGKAAANVPRSGGASSGVRGFKSKEEMLTAMGSPRFKGVKADPAYVAEVLAKRDAYYESLG